MWKTTCALVLVTAPALADWNMNGKTIECYCTDSTGGKVDIGEMTCLFVDGKMFMAKCDMSLNVPIWRKVSDGCLSSALTDPKQAPPARSRSGDQPVATLSR